MNLLPTSQFVQPATISHTHALKVESERSRSRTIWQRRKREEKRPLRLGVPDYLEQQIIKLYREADHVIQHRLDIPMTQALNNLKAQIDDLLRTNKALALTSSVEWIRTKAKKIDHQDRLRRGELGKGRETEEKKKETERDRTEIER